MRGPRTRHLPELHMNYYRSTNVGKRELSVLSQMSNYVRLQCLLTYVANCPTLTEVDTMSRMHSVPWCLWSYIIVDSRHTYSIEMVRPPRSSSTGCLRCCNHKVDLFNSIAWSNYQSSDL